MVYFYIVVFDVKSKIGCVEEIVGEIFFNYIIFIFVVDNEVVYFCVGIYFYDVLKYGFVVNFNYWFGFCCIFFVNLSFIVFC